MNTCLYNGNEIYSWKLKDEDNQYERELLGQWARASERKELNCLDCGERVILKAKDIREPHFAHLTTSQCPYSTSETQESLRGKRLLINMVERCFPGRAIETKHKMPDGKYCTVFVRPPTGIAVDFHYAELQNINYDERSQYYLHHNIPFLHVFSGSFNGKTKTIALAQKYTIQKLQGFCFFLNMHEEINTISIEYEMPEKHPERKIYEQFKIEDRMTNYRINDEGDLFYQPADSTIQELIKKYREEKLAEYIEIEAEKERQRAKQETAALKAAEEAKATKEKAEAERKKREDEWQRQQEEQQRLDQLSSEKRAEELKKKREEYQREEAIREQEREKQRKEYYEDMLSKPLIRSPYGNADARQNARSMKVIEESWTLPPLLTRRGGISEKNSIIRELYLKELSTWLFKADIIQKERLIHYASDRIEKYRFEDEWDIREYRKDFSFMKECKNCVVFDKFICVNSYDDGWCKYFKCVAPNGACKRVKRICEYCHYNQI
ncbi:MAG: competence protein CoiA family protein [Mobilitalea sp.]